MLKEGEHIKNRIVIASLFFLILKSSLVFSAEENIQFASRDMAMMEAFREAELDNALSEGQMREGTPSFFLSHLHPYGSCDMQYNDNVYLVKDNKKGYTINRLNPGLKFVLGERKTTSAKEKLELDLGAILNSYFENSKLNSQLPYLALSSEYGRGRYTFDLDYSFNELTTTNSNLESGGTEGLTKFDTSHADASWEATFKRLGFAIGYNGTQTSYTKDFKASNTYLDQYLSFTGFFNPPSLPKTRFLLEYDLGMVEYTKASNKDNDADYGKVWVGVDGKLTSKLSGLVKFGFENRSYKGGTDNNTSDIDINVDYRYSPKTTVSILVSRGTQEATNRSDSFSDTTSLSLSCNYAMRPRLALKLGMDYSLQDYKSGKQDNNLGESVALEYAFHNWLKMLLSYNYNLRDSSTSNNSYQNNIYSLGMEVAF